MTNADTESESFVYSRQRSGAVFAASQVPVQACHEHHCAAPEAGRRRAAYEEQAEKEKQQLLADAQKQADAIVAEGKRNAEAERQHKLREADAQTTALAREMCEKLLARNLTQQDDARLLDDLLQKAGVDDGN